MRQVLLFVALAATAGCLRQTQFHCDTDADCGSGTCEVVGYCSFADSDCPDGRRYGELSGPHAGACVGATDMPDAGSDSGDDAPANLDGDGDGILNGVDNCQAIANPDQYNEDGDTLGDVCDPCPISMNNADGDSDGVGDACDPRPTMPGDVLELFEGFQGGVPTGNGWTSTGTWTAANGSVSTNPAAGAASTLGRPFTSTTHETVSAAFTVLAFNGTTNTAGVFTNSTMGCVSYRYMGGFGVSLFNAANTATAQIAVYEMMLSGSYVEALRRDVTAYRCTSSRAATMTTATSTGTFTVASIPYLAGLQASGVSAQFDWVMIVRDP